jgi:hypothetical protein
LTQLIQRFLGAGDALARLRDHAARLRRLQTILDQHLPGSLAGACSVANLKGDTLIVMAQNGAVAAKLKQLANTLTEQFIASGVALKTIQIKVTIQEERDAPPAPMARTLSETGRDSISEFAASLPTDSSLRESLERLVARSRNSGKN